MKKITIVALGDSITNGVRIGVEEEDTFRYLLQKDLSRMTGYEVEVINAGVNGDISTTAIHRLKRDVLGHCPSYVTVMFGVNDAGYYRPATDSMADTPRVTAEDFRSNLKIIINAIQEIGAEPVLVTPIPMNASYAHKDYPAYLENGLNYLVDEYADIIRELSSQLGLRLIDVNRAFSVDPDTDKLVPDGIHPNRDGHRFIGDIFVKEFTGIVKPPLLFYYGDRLISSWTQPIVDYLQTSLERFSSPTLVHASSQTEPYRDKLWDKYKAVGFAGVRREDKLDLPPNTEIAGFTTSETPDSLKGSMDDLKVFRGDAGWSRSVAECAINLTLNCLRQSAFHHTHLATGGTNGWNFYGGQLSDRIDVVSGELAGKRVGVLGLGKIGGHAGVLARAFGADVCGFDPYKDDAYFEQIGIQSITLEEMARWAQIIIVCASPSDSAKKILSAELVQSMAKGSIIVIVSRAIVTDFAEIRKRVLADEIVLGVDVYDKEPLPADDPLRNRWNVVHFPHIAGRTFDSGKRFVDLCAEGFRRYFAGEDVPKVIRPGDLPHEPSGWLCE